MSLEAKKLKNKQRRKKKTKSVQFPSFLHFEPSLDDSS